MTFAVEAADGSELARGKDLGRCRPGWPPRPAVPSSTRWGRWSGPVCAVGPRTSTRYRAASPAEESGVILVLVAAGTAVDLRVFASAAERDAAMRAGVRRLVRLSGRSPVKALEKQLDPRRRLVLGNNPDGSLAALLEDCADAAADLLVPEVWTRAEFGGCPPTGRLRTQGNDRRDRRRVEKVLTALQEVQLELPGTPTAAQADAVADIRRQLAGLVGPGFVAATGAAHLIDLARYLTAISRRLGRLSQAPAADRERMARVHAVEDAHNELVQALSPARGAAADVRDIARLIEEFR